MIVIRIEGGLANRMFQYALYLAVSQTRDDVFVDESSFRPVWSFEKISLENTFSNVKCPQADMTRFPIYKREGKICSLIRNVLETYSKHYFYEKEFKYYPSLISNLPQDCYLRGFWQTEKYFKPFENTIRKAFTFDDFDEERNILTSVEMGNTNSISIHVRKGEDYSKNGGLTAGTCQIDYYESAISYIKNHVENPVFYVFTDNPNWVINNIKGISYILVDWNPTSGKKNYRDIQLMSYCKHNIIANSSFSWWGAWLNQNVGKKVIAPKIWFNPNSKIKSTPDIVPEEWIRL